MNHLAGRRRREFGEIRKIQVTGGSTFIVSLPKHWVTNAGLHPGDSIVVYAQNDNTLLLMPLKEASKRKEVTLGIKNKEWSIDRAVRMLVASYVAGGDIVKLVVKDGTAPIEDKKILRDFINVEELKIINILQRMHKLVWSMIKDTITAFLNLDKDLARDVIMRDDEIDRFYFLFIRQLNLSLQDRRIMIDVGLEEPADAINLAMVARNVERIADHTAYISDKIIKLTKKPYDPLKSKIEELTKAVIEVFNEAMNALYSMNDNMALRAIERATKYMGLEEEIERIVSTVSATDKDTPLLRLIIERLRGMLVDAEDIAEHTMDMIAIRKR
ncbi:MAG: hypothetical protein B6U75_04115 [Desulfurococcales archaeon ex4484_217_1]|nr:MAG: hypothetical protein B6U75_04115 [Desulfurococcales archaeon ex4484_217_1]